jgi:Zn-dependent peptidase ImmA (M78 family)
VSDATRPHVPQLAIICSSESGRARLTRAAAALLSRMPPELAAMLARRVIVVALDTEKHAAFCQGFGDAQDLVGQLAAERVAQGSAATPADQLVLIAINLDAPHRPPGVAFTLAHELGHVACGHVDIPTAAAAPLSEEQIDEREREADAFAERYRDPW